LIRLLDLLNLCGFDATKPTVLVRHQDPMRYPIDELRRTGWLELYLELPAQAGL